MDTRKLRKYLEVSATDTSVGMTDYGEMTIPYANGASDAEDAKTLSLTPLALRKDQGSLGDEHWQNPRRAHYWADRYLNMVKPPKGVSSQTGRKHADGSPCKAKDPESCPLEKKADKADEGVVASGDRTKIGGVSLPSYNKATYKDLATVGKTKVSSKEDYFAIQDWLEDVEETNPDNEMSHKATEASEIFAELNREHWDPNYKRKAG